jgi:hypothetical protein
MAAPAVGPYPVIILRTPSGMPACLQYQKYKKKEKQKSIIKGHHNSVNISTS